MRQPNSPSGPIPPNPKAPKTGPIRQAREKAHQEMSKSLAQLGKVEVDREDPLKGLEIRWNDGLPKDRTEDVANEVALYTAGLTSRYSSILRLNDGDAEATEKEIERIEEEGKKTMEDELALGGAQFPPDQLGESAQVVATARQGAVGDTRTPEEGGKTTTASTTSGGGGSKPPPKR